MVGIRRRGLADNVNSWKPLIEAAYERATERKRGSVRYWLMAVRDTWHDHAGVLRLAPAHFTGKFALQKAVWTTEAAFVSGSKRLPVSLPF